MSASLAFDLLLAVALLWSAWRSLSTPDLTRAVVMFIVFGLLMALAWARLSAPDIALAEAAIGAGLTGALLLDALGALRGEKNHATSNHSGRKRIPPFIIIGGVMFVGLGLILALFVSILNLPAVTGFVRDAVAIKMPMSGVEHPVTAVLLNFRGYDTLLEIAVLLLALLVVLAVAGGSAPMRSTPARSSDPVLQALARLATPLMILTAGYLLWAGAHRPGGAFQAGAVLAAALVLLNLAGLLPAWTSPGKLLRVGLAGGFLIFLAVAALLLGEGALLRYPPASAGALILLIEAGLSLSLGLTLAGLFLFASGRRVQS
jgi:multisubunit Na+/H+ antiporter MnhB subunit